MLEYIIVDSLGGGLGNLLFQHHVGMALSLKHNAPLIIKQDSSTHQEDTIRPPFTYYQPLFKHVQFKTTIEVQQLSQNKRVQFYQEPEFQYRAIHIHPEAQILILKGYFQSYKYFDSYRETIMKLLKMNLQSVIDSIHQQYKTLSQEKHTVCVHIRRTDYLKLPEYHPIIPEEYYRKALVPYEGYRILVFSDDIGTIQTWKLWETYDCVMVQETDALRSMYLMSFCNSFIIANSSMSLNAYYMRLHEEASITMPSIWFGPKGPKYELSDFVEKMHIIQW
jgi:hypothetical protein